MNNKLLALIKPSVKKVLLFIALVFFMPVLHIRLEPVTAIANNEFVLKTNQYKSLFYEVVNGYISNIDLFIGTLIRDYSFNNLIGVPLLVLYYLTACVFVSLTSVFVMRFSKKYKNT